MANTELLSPRELEVAKLLIQGKSNKQIALELGISVHTVEFHLQNIYDKLEVDGRSGAIVKLVKIIGQSFPKPGNPALRNRRLVGIIEMVRRSSRGRRRGQDNFSESIGSSFPS